MPNWNTTDYTLYGNKDNIKRLYTDLKNTVDIDRTKESKPFTFLGNSYWLGYIKKHLLPEFEEELPARGEISYIEEDIKDYGDDMASLKLTTETAWVACSELMDKIAEKYDLQLFYYSEEPGCGIFETNDVEGQFYSFRYMVDSEKRVSNTMIVRPYRRYNKYSIGKLLGKCSNIYLSSPAYLPTKGRQGV